MSHLKALNTLPIQYSKQPSNCQSLLPKSIFKVAINILSNRLFDNFNTVRRTLRTACCPLHAEKPGIQPVVGNTHGTRVEQVVSSFQKILRGSQIKWYIILCSPTHGSFVSHQTIWPLCIVNQRVLTCVFDLENVLPLHTNAWCPRRGVSMHLPRSIFHIWKASSRTT